MIKLGFTIGLPLSKMNANKGLYEVKTKLSIRIYTEKVIYEGGAQFVFQNKTKFQLLQSILREVRFQNGRKTK